MLRRFAALVLLLVLALPAYAGNAVPLSIGVQWSPDAAHTPGIALDPNAPHDAGSVSGWYFPNGGLLHGATMQMAGKADKFELLAGLIMTSGSTTTPILRGYIYADGQTKNSSQSFMLPGANPITIPAGSVIWACAQGWGATFTTPLMPELHATLFVSDAPGAVVYP